MNKKALSAIVSTILIIGITLVAGVMIFGFIREMAEGKLKEAKSCYGVFEKIEINPDYTCYNESSSEIKFSLSRKEIELDYLLISISSSNNSKTFKLYEESQNVEDVFNYTSKTGGVSLPEDKSGKTYIMNWTENAPSQIEIAPVINEKNCGVVDENSPIPLCS